MPVRVLLLCLAVAAACGSPDAAPVAPNAPGTPAVQVREGFPVTTPAAAGIDQTVLAQIVATAQQQHSDALIVVRDGKLVYENYFGGVDGPILAASVTKSFVDLAYGFLLADGTLRSLDAPVAPQLPGFTAVDARKGAITYRQLLSHTSGIDPSRASLTGGDVEAHVDSSRLVFAPGTAWQYANNGVEVLSVLVRKLAGEQLDAYLDARLFAPLGIHSVSWSRDVSGVPFGDGEMSIRPLDLAKVGQLILDGGTWQGKPIVAPAWLDSSFAQSSAFEPTYGFLWWRIANVTAYGMTADMLAQWRAAGIPDSTLAKLQPVVGVSFPTYAAYVNAWGRLLTSKEFDAVAAILSAGDHLPYYRTLAIGPVLGYEAEGSRGQFLVLIPAAHLVAVRMRRATAADRTSTTELDGYPTFPYDVARLVP